VLHETDGVRDRLLDGLLCGLVRLAGDDGPRHFDRQNGKSFGKEAEACACVIRFADWDRKT
jgi:hypothetical protein